MADYTGIVDDTAMSVGSRTSYKNSEMMNLIFETEGSRNSKIRTGVSDGPNHSLSDGLRNNPMSPVIIRISAQTKLNDGQRKSNVMVGTFYQKNEMQVVRLPNKVDGIRQGDDSNFKFQATPRKFPLDNSWIKNSSKFKRNR